MLLNLLIVQLLGFILAQGSSTRKHFGLDIFVMRPPQNAQLQHATAVSSKCCSRGAQHAMLMLLSLLELRCPSSLRRLCPLRMPALILLRASHSNTLCNLNRSKVNIRTPKKHPAPSQPLCPPKIAAFRRLFYAFPRRVEIP